MAKVIIGNSEFPACFTSEETAGKGYNDKIFTLHDSASMFSPGLRLGHQLYQCIGTLFHLAQY